MKSLETCIFREMYVFGNTALFSNYFFKQYMINNFPHFTFNFIEIPYLTRGPVETMYMGIRKIRVMLAETGGNLHQPILFLDNDNVYDLTVEEWEKIPTNSNFMFISKNTTGLPNYSFVALDPENKIIDIQEKIPLPGTDWIGCGGYGFADMVQCQEMCQDILMSETEDGTKEPFTSTLIKNFIQKDMDVLAYPTHRVYTIGTPSDYIRNMDKITTLGMPPLRVVFDLDNTLVTYPTSYKDYSTVLPITPLIDFVKKLKEKGHKIIIYTARNMVTSQNNVGVVIKNVGQQTMESLNALGIPYDELHFGKPYGDLYFDDKGYNGYEMSVFTQCGFFEEHVDGKPFGMNTNAYNSFFRVDKTRVQKNGPDLEGEIFYYSQVSNHPSLQRYFPKYYGSTSKNSFTIEYINGTPLSKIYCENLLSTGMLTRLLKTLYDLHEKGTLLFEKPSVSEVEIRDHYMVKLRKRFETSSHYPFEDASIVFQRVVDRMEEFLQFVQLHHPLLPLIHGDFWFSNILLHKQQFVMIDMRGKFYDKPALYGHAYYDYAKILQSILGLDSIIMHDAFPDPSTQEMTEKAFWETLAMQDVAPSPRHRKMITYLTGYLLFNTFYFYPPEFELSKKQKIWDLVKKCINLM
jgi:capsule biosynthesis phosphatase